MIASTTAQEYASQIRATTDKATAVFSSIPDEKWLQMVPNEGRAANVLASHIALSLPSFAGLLGAIANGQPLPPITLEAFDHMAIEHAGKFGQASKAEVLQQLSDGAQQILAATESLSDADLAKTSVNTMLGQTWNVAMVVGLAVSHTSEHLAALSAAQ